MYEENDLRNLHAYLKKYREDLKNDKEPDETTQAANNKILELMRLMEALRYKPLVIVSAWEDYDIADLMVLPLDDVPLHLNDQGHFTRALMKWRLEYGK